MKWWLSGGVAVAVAVAFLFHFGNRPYREIENRIAPLKTEQEVIEQFGNPARTALAGESNYYVSGYARKERPISKKVLMYFPSNLNYPEYDIILYVYIDASGRIEDYFVGGS